LRSRRNVGEAVALLTFFILSALSYTRAANASSANGTTNDVDNSSLHAEWPAAAHVDAGIMLLESNQLEEAATRFVRAIELDPEHGSAYYHLGTALYHLQNTAESVKQFHYSTLLLPNHAEAYLHLGVALRETGDDLAEPAAQNLMTATELNPQHALAYSYLGSALHANKMPEEALSALQSCIDIAPDIPAAHHNYGTVLLDLALDAKPEEAELYRDSAAVFFEDALKLEPTSVDSTYMLASADHVSGRIRAALKMYKRVLELDPSHAETNAKIADVEREARHEDAIDAAIDSTVDDL